MSNRSLVACIGLVFCLTIFATGCKKGCGTCPNFGNILGIGTNVAEVCNNNVCMCPNGLEGDSCQTLSLLKFFQPSATWQVTDNCNATQYYVTMTYNQSSNLYNNVFYINGLFGGAVVEADILSNASHQGVNLYIPAQNTPDGTINSGTGLYQSTGALAGKITLTLDYTNNAGLDIPCTVFLYQQ